MTKPDSEVFEDAADRVERGWCQGEFTDGAGGVCASEAIWNGVLTGATGDYMDQMRQYHRLRHEFAREVAIGLPGVCAWNDAYGRTQQEVVDAFRAAAKNARIAEEA